MPICRPISFFLPSIIPGSPIFSPFPPPRLDPRPALSQLEPLGKIFIAMATSHLPCWPQKGRLPRHSAAPEPCNEGRDEGQPPGPGCEGRGWGSACRSAPRRRPGCSPPQEALELQRSGFPRTRDCRLAAYRFPQASSPRWTHYEPKSLPGSFSARDSTVAMLAIEGAHALCSLASWET